MCGICGFTTSQPNEKNYDRMRKLLLALEDRGKEATGVAVVDRSEVKILKEPMMAKEFVEQRLPSIKNEISRANLCIGHTRLPTMGKPENNNNNHPIVSDSWVLVHNGTCSSIPKIEGYKYLGEVDTEFLLAWIEKDGLDGLAKTGIGSGAVALINRQHPDCIYLLRHYQPLALAYDEASDTLFFASTDKALKTGLINKLIFFSTFQIVDEIPMNTIYKLSVSVIHVGRASAFSLI